MQPDTTIFEQSMNHEDCDWMNYTREETSKRMIRTSSCLHSAVASQEVTMLWNVNAVTTVDDGGFDVCAMRYGRRLSVFSILDSCCWCQDKRGAPCEIVRCSALGVM